MEDRPEPVEEAADDSDFYCIDTLPHSFLFLRQTMRQKETVDMFYCRHCLRYAFKSPEGM